jgi:hypothetical protein
MASSPQTARVTERKVEGARVAAPAPQTETKKRKFYITIVSQVPG